jgi:hypothetical protein
MIIYYFTCCKKSELFVAGRGPEIVAIVGEASSHAVIFEILPKLGTKLAAQLTPPLSRFRKGDSCLLCKIHWGCLSEAGRYIRRREILFMLKVKIFTSDCQEEGMLTFKSKTSGMSIYFRNVS